jgi:hypothetical protein
MANRRWYSGVPPNSQKKSLKISTALAGLKWSATPARDAGG